MRIARWHVKGVLFHNPCRSSSAQFLVNAVFHQQAISQGGGIVLCPYALRALPAGQFGTHAIAPRISVPSRGSLTHQSPPSALAKTWP